jgi:WD40 repeat protein
MAVPLEHQAAVASAAFSRYGTRVVTASGDKTARVWDAATGTPVTRPLAHHAEVVSLFDSAKLATTPATTRRPGRPSRRAFGRAARPALG